MYFVHSANVGFRYATAKICESIETKENVVLRDVHATVANFTTSGFNFPFLHCLVAL